MRREQTDCQAVPTVLILDRHTSGLYQPVSCQNPDFHTAGTLGLWAGISGKSSRHLLRQCVKEERARAQSRSI